MDRWSKVHHSYSLIRVNIRPGDCNQLVTRSRYGQEGWTALHASSILGKLDVVKMLIEKRADVQATNNVSSGPRR
jgi:hypothetical protein